MTITIRSAALLALLTIAFAAAAAPAATSPVVARPASDAVGSRTIGPYVYDGSGNIKAIGGDAYSYDAVGRIKSVKSDGTAQQSYGYDAFGNLTSIDNELGAHCVGDRDCGIARAVTSSTNRLTESPGVIEYDAAGNLVRLDATYQYSYDAAGMMTATGGASPRQFIYTVDDERIATRAGTQWNWTVRDLKGAVLSEYTSQETATTAEWTEDYVYRGTSLLAASLPQGRRRHFHLDHLGTPRLVTDDQGRQLGVHKYLPFGSELEVGPRETPEELRKFTGHERDLLGETHELDYMHARYYTAVGGRFLSVDPAWDSADVSTPQSWNRYSYVRNVGMNATDPDGRRSDSDAKSCADGGGNRCAQAMEHYKHPSFSKADTLFWKMQLQWGLTAVAAAAQPAKAFLALMSIGFMQKGNEELKKPDATLGKAALAGADGAMGAAIPAGAGNVVGQKIKTSPNLLTIFAGAVGMAIPQSATYDFFTFDANVAPQNAGPKPAKQPQSQPQPQQTATPAAAPAAPAGNVTGDPCKQRGTCGR
jgi:RHS repeat-associated protein